MLCFGDRRSHARKILEHLVNDLQQGASATLATDCLCFRHVVAAQLAERADSFEVVGEFRQLEQFLELHEQLLRPGDPLHVELQPHQSVFERGGDGARSPVDRRDFVHDDRGSREVESGLRVL